MPSNIESIVREYIKICFPNKHILYNYRPDWLRYTTGNNLELDIFIPSVNLAIEVNGFQHNLKENMVKDAFKATICKKEGVRLLVIKNPRQLLRAPIHDALASDYGASPKKVPYTLIQKIHYYKPKKLRFTKAIKSKLHQEKCVNIQLQESAQNLARAPFKKK